MGRKLKRIRPAAAYVIAILAFVLICFVVGRIPTGDSISSSETSDSTQQDNSGLPWNLILVSNEIPLPENFHQVYQKWKSGRITGAEAAKECGMPPTTFRYKAKIYEKATLL